MITSANQWVVTEEIDLPSGKTARLRKPNMLALAASTHGAPDLLTQTMIDKINGKPAKKVEITAENFPTLLDSMRRVTKAAFVEPRIEDTPDYDNGVIAINDVDEGDLVCVFLWAQGMEMEQARSYLRQSVERLGAAPAEQDVPAEALVSDGDSE